MSALVYAAAADVRLIQAVRSQAVESVRALLKQRVDVNAPQGDGTTPLHWAAEVDNLVIADLLIRSGARADVANDNGFTPLHLACTNRSGPMVERLLAAGANATAASLNGETVLMTCARAGDAKAVKALLVRGAKVNAKEPAHDQTALMWAAAQSHPDVVRLLVEAGADLRARSKTYTQTVVSEEETQRTGREELNYTVFRGGSTPLLFAARVGDVESARVLLAAGVDSNDSLPDGTSALVLAAHSGHGDVAALLLDKGADPNGFGAGYTALHAAVLKSDVTLVKALLAHGANPNIRMTKPTPVRRDSGDFYLPNTLIGTTPYLVAAKFLEPDIMHALAAGGADVNQTMLNPPTQVKKPGDQKILIPDGATALMMAAGMGSAGTPGSGQPRSRRGVAEVDFGKVEPESRVLEGVTAAVSLGADVNAANEAGDTALHTAASQGYDTVVQFLADHGAQLNVKNKRGVTPLAAATGVPLAVPIVSIVTGGDALREIAHQSTVALLRQLGATQAPVAPANPSHVHIGHVMTSWKDTPNMQGFLPVAIADAKVAATHALLAAKAPDNLDQMKLHAGHVLNALDPTIEAKGPGSGYGVKKAAAGALQHVNLAAKAEGASANVKTHTAHVSASLNDVLQWTDQAIATAQKIRTSTFVAHAAGLVTDLVALVAATTNISEGVDANKDGQIGWQTGEGGLQQAQVHMGLMMKGEGM